MENPTLQFNDQSCPDLGAYGDAGISCTYVSTENTCFHCQNPEIPALAHQESFCLTAAYLACPVWAMARGQKFPAELRYEPLPDQADDHRTRQTWVMALLICFLILGLWLGWKPLMQFARIGTLPEFAPSPTSLLSHSASGMILTLTANSAPTASPVHPTNTRLPRPTLTSTPSPTLAASATIGRIELHLLDLPFNINTTSYLLHRVLAGETLEGLARKYSTSLDVIQKANLFITTPLWVGNVLVILPGTQTVDPAMPAFEPYQVPDAMIDLAALSTRLKVDPQLLQVYTDCQDSCQFDKGDWLMIPRLR